MTQRHEIVAVLVVDMVGSTTLRQTIGETRFRRRCRRVDEVTRTLVERHRGRVVKSQGDGVLVTFALASDALNAGVAILQAVAALNERAPADEVVALRLGVSGGEVVWEGAECDGLPLVEATRLEAAAESDTLVCSDVVKVLAGTGVEHGFVSIGDLALKGLQAPLPAWRLTWRAELAAATPGLPDELSSEQRLPFVGRRAELAALLEVWKRTCDGSGGLLALAGEPGVGKTRLCREFAQHVLGHGGQILYGRVDEIVGYPFQPFVEALRAYIGGARRVDIAPADATELVRLVPELRTLSPHLGNPTTADSDTQRYLLFEAMAGWVRSVASEDPVLLVLDDVTWASEPTLAMLRHMVTSLASAPVMFVPTYRPAEMTTFLDEVLADLHRTARVQTVGLGGLYKSDVLAALQGLLRDSPIVGKDMAALASTVWQRTGGNPFFVGEIFADMLARGALLPAGTAGKHDDAAELAMPHAVEDVVRRRVTTTSPNCRQVLQLASVVGLTFDPLLLERTSTLDANAVTDAVEEAERAGLVRSSDEISRYTFAHGIVRDVVYGGISAVRRAATHHRVGEAIEALYERSLDDHVDDLAHHFALAPSADDAARAVRYCREAAKLATARLAHGEAVSLYERALALLPRADPRVDPKVRLGFLIELGVAQHRGGVRRARETLLEAASFAASIGEGRGCARAVLACSRGIFSSTGTVDHACVASLRAALELIGDNDIGTRAMLLADLSVELSFTGDHTEQDQLSDEALALARDLGDLGVLIRVLSLRLVTLWRADRVMARLSLAAELDELCRQYGRPQATINVAMMQCQAAMEAGDFQTADKHLVTIDEVAAELRQPLALGYVRLRQSMRAAVSGDLDQSELLAREAYEYCNAAGQPDAEGFWIGQRFNIRFHQGRLDEIVDDLAQAADSYPGIVAFRAALAMVHSELHDTAGAQLALEAIFGPDGTGVPDDLNWLTSMAFAAHAAAYLADRELCTRLLAALLPYRGQFVDNASTFFGSVERYIGLTLSRLGDHDEAAKAFEQAAAAHENLRAPILLARTRLEWGEALIAAGVPIDSELVQTLFVQAVTAADRYSLGTISRRARPHLLLARSAH